MLASLLRTEHDRVHSQQLTVPVPSLSGLRPCLLLASHTDFTLKLPQRECPGTQDITFKAIVSQHMPGRLKPCAKVPSRDCSCPLLHTRLVGFIDKGSPPVETETLRHELLHAVAGVQLAQRSVRLRDKPVPARRRAQKYEPSGVSFIDIGEIERKASRRMGPFLHVREQKICRLQGTLRGCRSLRHA